MRRLHLTTGGESHGPGLTAILTGLPAGLRVDFDLLARDLARRQHGYGRGNRMKIEKDAAEVRGGVRGGETLGSPLVLWIANRDYVNWEPMMSPVEVDPRRAEQRRVRSPRPGHADLAGGIKYLRHDLRDVLERASARETTARVAAGAFARMLLAELGVEIRSGVRSLGPVGAGRPVPTWEDLLQVDESSPLRAIDRALEDEMVRLVDQAQEDGDTLGGAVTVIAHNVPAGLGSYVQWDEKLDGRLAQAVMSVHAVKAVEIGAGVQAAGGFGSSAHDPIARENGRWTRPTNKAGGLEGGVTNGEDVVITAYKKPIATLRKGMPSVHLDTMEAQTSQYERSDVTALPAAGVIAEAMVALVLADAVLEKLGGDSMTELMAHWEATLDQQRRWPS
ncbi:MAG TPA: chorismate synthase [Thermoanaerobaculia bacterium]|nr:chorismate synthase [Thermoanaerobaculia bacterium]